MHGSMQSDVKEIPGVKVLWILIDGIGDVSLESLGRRTPLETARTPACDAIACSGVSGMMDPVQAGAPSPFPPLLASHMIVATNAAWSITTGDHACGWQFCGVGQKKSKFLRVFLLLERN